MPEEIASQIPILKDIISYLGVKQIEVPGFEADDIMGSLSKIAESNDIDSYIVSGDKDMLQMDNNNIFVYSPGNRFKPTTKFEKNQVKSKMGVFPEKVIDLLSLMGDSSDNIPGVKGIGPKTAVKLIEEFGSVDKMIERVDEIKNERIKNLIKDNIKSLLLSKKLVTIKSDMEIEFNPLEFQFNEIKDKKKILILLMNLNFHQLNLL